MYIYAEVRIYNYSWFPIPPGCNLSDEDELLREALKRTKPVLCDRLPIELLPTVLEGESVIGGMECKLIKEERNSVERSLKLLELMEKKSIPVIRRFLEALKSKSDFCGYEYLADMVYSERAALVEKKTATTESEKSMITRHSQLH